MKKIAYPAFTALAALTLAACGSSDSASEEAQADNVEMPAEESMSTVDPAATAAPEASSAPAVDASAAASEAPADAAAAEKKL